MTIFKKHKKILIILSSLVFVSCIVVFFYFFHFFINVKWHIWSSELNMNAFVKENAIKNVCSILDDNNIKYGVEEFDLLTYYDDKCYESVETRIYTSYFDIKRASRILVDAELDIPGIVDYNGEVKITSEMPDIYE